MGLALGVACCLLIGLYIQNELSYDRYHREAENVARVLVQSTHESGSSISSVTPRYLSSTLAATFPEIEHATAFRNMSYVVGYDDKEYTGTRMLFAEPSFFQVFDFAAMQGDLTTALTEPNNAVLTRAFAEKIFGHENPLNKTLRVRLRDEFAPPTEVKVAAIMEDVPKNSHFKFDVVFPFRLYAPQAAPTGAVSWYWSEMKTYIRFKSSIDQKNFAAKLADFVDQTGGKRSETQLILQPLTSIHLAPALPFDDIEQTERSDLYVFSGIALLVLLIAGLNYMSLVTARYTQRLKEVGVRKIVGASSLKLILQFLIEAGLMALIALPLALGLVEIVHGAFGELLGKDLQVAYWNNFAFWGINFALLVLFALAAGLYPAFFFSKIGSVAALKGRSAGVGAAKALRKYLIVTQFGIAIVLLVCVGVMQTQLRYTRTKELGYRHDNLLAIQTDGIGRQKEVLKQFALSHSAVLAASNTSWLPGFLSSTTTMANPNGEGEIITEFVEADCDLLKTFDIQLVQGRDLDCKSPGDTLQVYRKGKFDKSLVPRVSVLLNETAVRALQLAVPVGMELNYGGLQGTVIGVVRDLHNLSLHQPINPMVIRYADYSGHLVVAYQAGREAEVLQHLRRAWEKLGMKSKFDYFYLNDHLRQLYKAEEKFMQMTWWFAALAVMLSCLGLFGLAVFSAEQRTKEIGVRKVLGASVAGIVGLLSGEVAQLVLLANLVAWPLAYYAMQRWLQGFAYRVEMEWWVFALAGGGTLLIALLTVSAQAFKAALANPVEALRYE